MVFSSIGKPNEFYFHVLNLKWNCKNISKDYRCQELIRGLNLQEHVEIDNLTISNETGWFKSSKKTDLAKIGKVSGYFFRMFACSVGQALDENFTDFYSRVDDKDLNDVINVLKDNLTIKPAIIKLEISGESKFDASKFLCLNEQQVNKLVNGKEIIATRRSKILEISSGLQDWAWSLLNEAALEKRRELLSDGVPITEETVPAILETFNDGSLEEQAMKRRPLSCRSRQPNKLYANFVA